MCPNVSTVGADRADREQRRSPGTTNNQFGQNSRRKRRWRQPSRKLRRCGARERPSGRSVVGTSLMRRFGEARLHDHLARELHAARAQPEIDDRVLAEPADAAVEVAHRRAEEQPADARQHRVADAAVQPRHRARLDAAREAVAHHEVVAVAEVLEERTEVLEVVAVVGVGHEHVRCRAPRGCRRSARCRSPCGAP